MFDPQKLSPAPWEAQNQGAEWCVRSPLPYPQHAITGWGNVEQTEDDACFIAAARNSFDVMMRRGWVPRPFTGDKYKPGDKWYLDEEELGEHVASGKLTTVAADPFTCLIEADKWYRENVEAKGETT